MDEREDSNLAQDIEYLREENHGFFARDFDHVVKCFACEITNAAIRIVETG